MEKAKVFADTLRPTLALAPGSEQIAAEIEAQYGHAVLDQPPCPPSILKLRDGMPVRFTTGFTGIADTLRIAEACPGFGSSAGIAARGGGPHCAEPIAIAAAGPLQYTSRPAVLAARRIERKRALAYFGV
jgi:hypothetical protein